MNIQDFTLKTYTPYAVDKPKVYSHISLTFGRPSSFGFSQISAAGTPSDIYIEFINAAIFNVPNFTPLPNDSYNVTSSGGGGIGGGGVAQWLLELVNLTNPYPQSYLDQLTQLIALNSYSKASILSIEVPQSPDYFLRVPSPFYVLGCIASGDDNFMNHSLNVSVFDLGDEADEKLRYGAALATSEFGLLTSGFISLDRSRLFDAGIYPVTSNATDYTFAIAELTHRE